jgi:quercetin 2,3-dioxygenase
MIELRRSDERGRADFGWLNAHYTFSFANYFDANYRGFRCLRVINEDRIVPGKGFESHPHDNMEIVTYVVSGELTHQDSMGNQGVIRAGEFQLMSAGSGVVHSEFNRSADTETHLLQMWITPDTKGLNPLYFEGSEFKGAGSTLIVSPSGRDGSMRIHQDVELSRWEFSAGEGFEQTLGEDRFAWVQVVSGSLALDGEGLFAGDGAMISEQHDLSVTIAEDCVALYFDLP